jgi:hypothetical protein
MSLRDKTCKQQKRELKSVINEHLNFNLSFFPVLSALWGWRYNLYSLYKRYIWARHNGCMLAIPATSYLVEKKGSS